MQLPAVQLEADRYEHLQLFCFGPSSNLPRRGRGMRFPQLQCALITAHLNRLAADLDLDRIPIQLAVASRTCGFNHDVPLLEYPKSGCDQ